MQDLYLFSFNYLYTVWNSGDTEASFSSNFINQTRGCELKCDASLATKVFADVVSLQVGPFENVFNAFWLIDIWEAFSEIRESEPHSFIGPS